MMVSLMVLRKFIRVYRVLWCWDVSFGGSGAFMMASRLFDCRLTM